MAFRFLMECLPGSSRTGIRFDPDFANLTTGYLNNVQTLCKLGVKLRFYVFKNFI